MKLLRTSMARESSLSLSQQLYAVFELATLAGDLVGGSRLPSVRRLAAELKVAPNTVMRAYRQLQDEGILRVRPRHGYYIAAVSRSTAGPASSQVEGLVDEALRSAERASIDTVRFLQIVSRQIKLRRERRYLIAVVGERDAALQPRVDAVHAALLDLAVAVTGLSFEDLATPDGQRRAGDVDLYLVPILDTERAAELLGPHAYRILPLHLSLAPESRAFIAARPRATTFGVIVGGERYRARLGTAVRQSHSSTARILTASVDNRRAVERVVREADVVLMSSAARARMLPGVEITQPAAELRFLPDTETLERIRAIVAADRLVARKQNGTRSHRAAAN